MQLMPVSPDNKSADYIDVFGGYNHNLRIGDSEFYDMENMSSDSYPMIGVRKKRGGIAVKTYYGEYVDVNGIIYHSNLYQNQIIPSGNRYIIRILKDNTEIAYWSSNDGDSIRTMIPMGANLIVIPDNVVVNTIDYPNPALNHQNIDNEKTTTGAVSVQPCTADGAVSAINYVGTETPDTPVDGFVWLDTRFSPAVLKKYYGSQATWQSFISSYAKITAPDTIGDGFKVGDGVRISGFTEENLKVLNTNTVIKYIDEDKKSVIVSGSLNPVPESNILTARETFTATGDNDYFYFLCDSELPANYFQNKDIKIGENEPWHCTESTLAIQNSNNNTVAYTWEDVDSITDVIKKIVIRKYGGSQSGTVIHLANWYKSNPIPEESIADNEDVVYDEAELKTLEGKTLRFGEKGIVATVTQAEVIPSSGGVGPFWKLTLDKSVEVEAGTLVGAVEQVANDKYVVGLKFSSGNGKTIIVGEQSCPTLDTQYVQSYNQNDPVTLSRRMPVMKFVIESQNRLWGCQYGKNNDNEFVNEIYCSKLGDPTNWNVYEGIATDSYAASCGTEGEWTGAFNYRGYPTFFKEHHIHTVYGSYPSSYQIKDMEARGVQKGSSQSLAIVNEVLFYKSIHGICAYSGGLPEDISSQLGDVSYHNAIGCAFKGKYYVNMLDSANNPVLMVYDTKKGMWHKEAGIDIIQMVATDDNVNYIALDEEKQKNGIGKLFGTSETSIQWSIETGLYGLSLFNKKYISRVNLRMSLTAESRVFLYIEYDSSGEWEPVGTFYGRNIHPFTLPIRTRRCDHFRLRVTGHGDMKLYGISKTIEQGSDK